MKKTTDKLLHILNASESIDAYLEEEQENLLHTTLSQELERILSERALIPAKVFRRAGIDKSYGYEILSGAKRPARDKVIALILAMELSQEEGQALLKATGYPPLYAKDARDSVLLFSLKHQYSVADANESLYDMGFATLS